MGGARDGRRWRWEEWEMGGDGDGRSWRWEELEMGIVGGGRSWRWEMEVESETRGVRDGRS